MIQLPNVEAKTEFFPNTKPLTKVTPASECKFSYHFIYRDKKHKAYICLAFVYVAGDCCSAVATDYFAENGFIVNRPFSCIVDGKTWQQFQLTQHLKQLKIKFSSLKS